MTNSGGAGVIFSLGKSELRGVKKLSLGHTVWQLRGIQTETYQAQGSLWLEDADTHLGGMFQAQLQVPTEADRHTAESHPHSELWGEQNCALYSILISSCVGFIRNI